LWNITYLGDWQSSGEEAGLKGADCHESSMVAGEEVLEMELEKQSQVLGDDASGTESLAKCI
jgi:hypothetical protein